MPLACAGQDQGMLLLMAKAPVHIHSGMRRLADDLCVAVGQALFTLACINQIKAGEQIIQDIMPEQVWVPVVQQ